MTESLYLLLAISVVFVIGIGAVFWWAIFSGQFDNAGEAGRSVLLDDDRTHLPESEINEHNSTGTGQSDQSDN